MYLLVCFLEHTRSHLSYKTWKIKSSLNKSSFPTAFLAYNQFSKHTQVIFVFTNQHLKTLPSYSKEKVTTSWLKKLSICNLWCTTLPHHHALSCPKNFWPTLLAYFPFCYIGSILFFLQYTSDFLFPICSVPSFSVPLFPPIFLEMLSYQ